MNNLRFTLCATIALAALPQTAIADERYRPAIPANKLGAAITVNDYPAQSIRLGEQGMTSVRYEIGEQGEVIAGSCVVLMTSGYERLDKRTCTLTAQFKFEPALKDGKPVREQREHSVTWMLPGQVPKFALGIALRQTRGFAQCAARERPADAARIVLAEFGSAEQEAAFKLAVKADRSGCWNLEKHVTFPVWLFAGGAAEQLIVSKRGDLSNASIASAILTSVAQPPRSSTEAFATCVMRHSALEVLDFVGTYPGSPGEVPVVQRVSPYLAPCLPAGEQLRLTKFAIRSLLMTALYREMVRLNLGSN